MNMNVYEHIYIHYIYAYIFRETQRKRLQLWYQCLKSLTNRTKGILDMSTIRFLKDITLLSL